MSASGTYRDFPGKIGRTRAESEPHWEAPLRARAGSPNVVIVLMDDLGWSDIGCYGSEIETPHIDALAARGVRLNHYTTHPICSPARAALLTGRNAHAVSAGWLANNDPGYPGYTGRLPLDAPTIAETLRAAGYATAMVGKWHNAPNGAAPNPSWPSFRGFDRFYGFLEGETSYFYPARIQTNTMLAPIDEYPAGYYATDDWMEKAIGFVTDIRNHDATRPFFLYIANNAVHSPLQAKEADLAKHRGRYDAGWDVLRARRFARQKALGIVPEDAMLSPRDPEVPSWDDVPEDRRRLFARHMETYAAMLDCVDQNLGRLTEHLRNLGELDNTIIVFTSDNGGTSAAGPLGTVNFNRRFAGLPPLSAEVNLERAAWVGTDRVTPLYPTGWGQVSNTPFPSYKTYTGGGGRRVSFVLSWPERVTDLGAIRPHFAHVTDVMPTLLDLCGVAPLTTSHGMPAQAMHGATFAGVLRDASAVPARREQYYECWANRAYYRDGWLAVSLQIKGQAIDFDNWTLHRHSDDFAETIDLASRHPEILRELVASFDAAAWGNLVYPLDNRTPIQKFNERPPHLRPPARGRRRFLPGGQTVHLSQLLPLIADRSFTVRVGLRHREGDSGVLFAIGDVAGGMVAYVEDAQAQLFYNGFGEFHRLRGPGVPDGAGEITLEYEAIGGRRGRGRLLVDGEAGEWGELSPSLLSGFHEGLDIGLDRRGPVSWELKRKHGAFRYGGVIHDLVIDAAQFPPDSPFAE